MNDKKPSIQEWKDLYAAAIEFKNIKCWDWMWDTDIFGVQNPENGEIGYCCVMGGAGEHYALGVYLGSEGLDGYLKIRTGSLCPSLEEVLDTQNLLMASFEDRKYLEKEDLKLIKELGLKFSGPKSWPLFRSYQPGCFPWYLTSEEARYLTLCLKQAIEVSLRFKDDSEMLTPPAENRYLVRVPQKQKEENDLSWRDIWMEPLPLEKTEIRVELTESDRERLERIKDRIPHRQGIWEADFFYYPHAIKERDERPFYPYVALWVDHNSGFIFSHNLAKPAECIDEFPRQFLKVAEEIGFLPQEIFVKKEEAFQLLKPITSELGINLRKLNNLEMLEETKASMFKFTAGE